MRGRAPRPVPEGVTQVSAVGTAPPAGQPRSSTTYPWYVVGVLMTAYTLSFIDRQILSLLVAPMKAGMGISDTEVAYLQGLAFAAFYTTFGLPMGYLVDRFNRRNLVACGVFLWSAMTALCGLAGSYPLLFLARMGVGVGEATLSPAAFSLIADYFSRERLGTAMSVYSMGVFIGSGLAFIVGGLVVEAVVSMPSITLPLGLVVESWRLAFFVVGLPGLLVAALVLTVREPARRGVSAPAERTQPQLFVAGLRLVRERWASVLAVTAGMAGHAICMYGVFAWVPTVFIRVHGWTTGQAGVALGAVVLVFGCGGMVLGGWLCDRWHRLGLYHAPLRVGVVAASGAALALVPAFTGSSVWLTLGLLLPGMLFLSLPVGSMFASLQLIFPNEVRGQVSALLLCVISIIGISLGPLLPALLTDYVFADPLKIGRALAVIIGGGTLLMGGAFRAGFGSYASAYRKLHPS